METPHENRTGDFMVSDRVLIPDGTQATSPRSADRLSDYENLGELPRSYGRPILFAIARDPHTLFAYWDIDWQAVFGVDPPADRKAYLRIFSADGTQENTVPIEPLAGNCCITVAEARSSYRIEIGYHQPANVWHSVVTSETVMTPPDDVAEETSIDVATVPFHLSFQRLIDFFRGSKYDGDALTEILARLQNQTEEPAATVTTPERELLRAIGWGLSGTEAIERSRLRDAAHNFSSRRRIEAILGFAATSPGRGFSSRV